MAGYPLLSTGPWKGDLRSDSHGKVHAAYVDHVPEPYTQGAAEERDVCWLTRNVPATPGKPKRQGRLLTYRWGSAGAWTKGRQQTISYGPEDLSCWRGQHQVWTVAEHPGQRALYAVRAPDCR
jgi:hypothetical protein